jgi:hypothetical protein
MRRRAQQHGQSGRSGLRLLFADHAEQTTGLPAVPLKITFAPLKADLGLTVAHRRLTRPSRLPNRPLPTRCHIIAGEQEEGYGRRAFQYLPFSSHDFVLSRELAGHEAR